MVWISLRARAPLWPIVPKTNRMGEESSMQPRRLFDPKSKSNLLGGTMAKSIAYTTTMLAFAGALAVASPARADETISSTHGFAVEKWIDAMSSPDGFGSMLITNIVSVQYDTKIGQARVQSFWSGKNSDGTLAGASTGLSKFTMDPKTQATKASTEGTLEITDGTGRYANVRGHGSWKAEANGDNATGQQTVTVTGLEKRASTQ
jgi:hypothetical protein